MYAWEVLSHNDFESLFDLNVRKVPPKCLSDHWLTEGELWTLCGLDRYGTLAHLSRNVPYRQSAVRTAGNTSKLLV